MPSDFPDHIVVMFADVSGSTHLYESLGDTLAHTCISASLSRICYHVESHRGRVVETIGDEVMATFYSIDEAASAAVAMQQHFFHQPVHQGHYIGIRIGFHYGPIEYDEGHPFGDTVNVAARVVSLCESGRIIATRQTLDHLRQTERFYLRPYQRARVKGKSKPLLVVELVWNSEDSTSLFNATNLNLTTQFTLTEKSAVIRHLQDAIRLTPDSPPLVFGRGQHCDIVTESNLASRNHGKIEFRDGEFVIVDHSTNGTYVQMLSGKRASDGTTVRLHRREFPLRGKGMVSVGVAVEHGRNPCLLQFEVDEL